MQITQSEPKGKKKISRMTKEELKNLSNHLIAQNQEQSERFKQVQKRLK